MQSGVVTPRFTSFDDTVRYELCQNQYALDFVHTEKSMDLTTHEARGAMCAVQIAKAQYELLAHNLVFTKE